jgi:divinyl protochlorophyllide a 8-vinyl-reductase
MTQARSAAIDHASVAPQSHRTAADIGPNAVIQLIHALNAAGLDQAAATIFASASAGDWLKQEPTAMVDERRVAVLHQSVRRMLSPAEAGVVLADAGRRTADYILANRIPKFAQTILKLLPAPLAARLLTKAITAHAWTFAGSGRFSGAAGRPTIFEIAANPLCANEHAERPVCVWHAAVFQRLFQVLVSPNTRVVETGCGASGSACCHFVLDWRAEAGRDDSCTGPKAECCGGTACCDAETADHDQCQDSRQDSRLAR